MFFRQTLNAWILINFLEGMQFSEEICRYAQIVPRQIKCRRQTEAMLAILDSAILIFGVVAQSPSTNAFCHFFNYVVFRLCNIDYDTTFLLYMLNIKKGFFCVLLLGNNRNRFARKNLGDPLLL